MLWCSAALLPKYTLTKYMFWSHQRKWRAHAEPTEIRQMRTTIKTDKNTSKLKRICNILLIYVRNEFCHWVSLTLWQLIFTALFWNSIRQNYNFVFHFGKFATNGRKKMHSHYCQLNKWNVCQTTFFFFSHWNLICQKGR